MTEDMLKVIEKHARTEAAEAELLAAATSIEIAASLFDETGDFHRAARARVGAKLIRQLRTKR